MSAKRAQRRIKKDAPDDLGLQNDHGNDYGSGLIRSRGSAWPDLAWLGLA